MLYNFINTQLLEIFFSEVFPIVKAALSSKTFPCVCVFTYIVYLTINIFFTDEEKTALSID